MIIPLADRLGGVKEYYFVKKLEQIRELISQGHDVINFGIGSPDMPPSEEVVNELSKTAISANAHGYQPYRSTPELRSAIADWYKRTYQVDLDPSEAILPLMGSKEGILHITLAFINPGDEILVPNPGYPTYSSLTKLLGGEKRLYDLKEENGWYPDFEEIEKEDLSKVKIMWLNYPHMPTGTPAKRAVFEQCVAFAKKHQILLCHDNPYSLVLNKENPLSIFSVEGAQDLALELNSFSKAQNMAGWRVGMVTGKKDYIDNILRVKSNIDSGMFLGIQKAATVALQQPESWHQERNAVYAKRREWVWKILDHLGFEYSKDQEGMFVWAKPKNEIQIDDLPAYIDRILEEHYIFFTPGFIFGSNGEGYIRLSLCVSAEKMEEAYNRLS